MPPLRTIWGKRIAEARRAAGLTQVQLAAALTVDQQQVSAWERGIASPRSDRRVAVARALGVDPNILFAYPDEPNGEEAA